MLLLFFLLLVLAVRLFAHSSSSSSDSAFPPLPEVELLKANCIVYADKEDCTSSDVELPLPVFMLKDNYLFPFTIYYPCDHSQFPILDPVTGVVPGVWSEAEINVLLKPSSEYNNSVQGQILSAYPDFDLLTLPALPSQLQRYTRIIFYDECDGSARKQYYGLEFDHEDNVIDDEISGSINCNDFSDDSQDALQFRFVMGMDPNQWFNWASANADTIILPLAANSVFKLDYFAQTLFPGEFPNN